MVISQKIMLLGSPVMPKGLIEIRSDNDDALILVPIMAAELSWALKSPRRVSMS